jgi:hypothetical protein
MLFTKHFIIVASLGGFPQESYGFLPKPSYSASSLVCFALATATGATALRGGAVGDSQASDRIKKREATTDVDGSARIERHAMLDAVFTQGKEVSTVIYAS